jgi:hypothetical protein
MEQKLFAVYLGGRAPKCNTELHDVVFVVGSSIEATYHQLMDKWFGDPLRLHVDSWMELRIVDGERIVLRSTPAAQARSCSSSISALTCPDNSPSFTPTHLSWLKLSGR